MPSGLRASGWCFTAAAASRWDAMRNSAEEEVSKGATTMETRLGQTRLPSVGKQKVRRLPGCLITGGPAAADKLLRSAFSCRQ